MYHYYKCKIKNIKLRVVYAVLTFFLRKHTHCISLIIIVSIQEGICVGFSTLTFYAINMDVVSLFTDSSFLFLAILIVSMYSINLNE